LREDKTSLRRLVSSGRDERSLQRGAESQTTGRAGTRCMIGLLRPFTSSMTIPKCRYVKAFDQDPSREHGLACNETMWLEKRWRRVELECLEALNFTTDPFEEKWNDMCNELLRCKRECGHCRVLDGDTNHPKLGEWLVRQQSANKCITRLGLSGMLGRTSGIACTMSLLNTN
jgi:hypothetical protein